MLDFDGLVFRSMVAKKLDRFVNQNNLRAIVFTQWPLDKNKKVLPYIIIAAD